MNAILIITSLMVSLNATCVFITSAFHHDEKFKKFLGVSLRRVPAPVSLPWICQWKFMPDQPKYLNTTRCDDFVIYQESGPNTEPGKKALSVTGLIYNLEISSPCC